MNRNNITREEWDALRYPIELQELSEEEGGGWMAWIPALGKGAFMVDADTAAEAIENLEAHRRSMYDTVVASGKYPIPIPEDVTDAPQASGKWLQRASRRLHAELRAAAEKDGVSFNTYCENAMLRGHMTLAAESAMSNLAEGICEDFRIRVEHEAKQARYTFDGVKFDKSPLKDAEGYEEMDLGGWDGQNAA